MNFSFNVAINIMLYIYRKYLPLTESIIACLTCSQFPLCNWKIDVESDNFKMHLVAVFEQLNVAVSFEIGCRSLKRKQLHVWMCPSLTHSMLTVSSAKWKGHKQCCGFNSVPSAIKVVAGIECIATDHFDKMATSEQEKKLLSWCFK